MLIIMIVLCGVLMALNPKRMKSIVIVAALVYVFPAHTFIVVMFMGIGYRLFKRFNPFK